MSQPTGVYYTTGKDHTPYYRSSVTIGGKHISLGSYQSFEDANSAYIWALKIYRSDLGIKDYNTLSLPLPFSKYVILVNYRDNGIYFKTPVYIFKKYFLYYLNEHTALKFDADDLFYYTSHTIMQRGGHLFVADYGMQVNILSRYGIREHAVCGRDYYFANGDNTDFRYGNVVIKNPYHGVRHFVKNGRDYYKVRIHINGDYVVGTYQDETAAAIAYNKAADILRSNGCKKGFPENYPENLSAIKYASIYNSVRISQRILDYTF